MGDTMSICQSIIATNRLYLTEHHTLRVILSEAAQQCNGERESRQMPRSRTPKGRRQAESRRSCKALYPTAPHTPNRRDSRTLPKLCTAPNDKNFPQEHPHHAKRNNSLPCKGGCSWGKFSEGVGGLEGEGRLFQEASLSLQGLPPPRSFKPSDTAPLRATRANRRRGRRLTRFSRPGRRREHGNASQRSRACRLWRDSRP